MKDAIAGKFQAVRYYLGQSFRHLNSWAACLHTRCLYRAYLRNTAGRHKVLVGPFLRLRGGTANHMRAISDYSSMAVGMFPSEGLLEHLLSGRHLQDFKRIVDVHDFDRFGILHTHADRWLTPMCREAGNRRFCWVHTYHTLYFPEHWDGGLAAWQEEMNQVLLQDASRADVRISIARWLQSHLADEHGIDTVYIPNGVRVDWCERAEGQRFTVRTGLEDFILFVGSIRDIKNPGAFIRLAGSMQDRQFVMIGRGLTEENIRQELDLEVPANLAVFDHITHGDVLDAMDACRVFVMTSRSEGLPTALMEAMAMAKPVVAPRSYGCAEVVGSERCGYLYQPGSFSDLVAQTHEALQDDSRGQSGRERVLQEYDWRVVAPQLDRVYERLRND
jgi:glycosyltransferase involved in cell wall biosynthesis